MCPGSSTAFYLDVGFNDVLTIPILTIEVRRNSLFCHQNMLSPLNLRCDSSASLPACTRDSRSRVFTVKVKLWAVRCVLRAAGAGARISPLRSLRHVDLYMTLYTQTHARARAHKHTYSKTYLCGSAAFVWAGNSVHRCCCSRSWRSLTVHIWIQLRTK